MLSKYKAEIIYTITGKGLFFCKRSRPYIQPIIAIFCSRVKNPNEIDAKTLTRMIKYLNGTK